jgi:hypothetical protein
MVPWRIERLQGFAVQQEQKSGLQVGELIAAAVGFQGGGAMGYIEDSTGEWDSWRSLYSEKGWRCSSLTLSGSKRRELAASITG